LRVAVCRGRARKLVLLAKEFGDKVRVKVYEDLNDVGLAEITLDNLLVQNSGQRRAYKGS